MVSGEKRTQIVVVLSVIADVIGIVGFITGKQLAAMGTVRL